LVATYYLQKEIMKNANINYWGAGFIGEALSIALMTIHGYSAIIFY